ALYRELAGSEPTPVVLANQAVAVAMADSAEAGLAILDRLASQGRLDQWPQLHLARAELLRRLGCPDEATAAYELALAAGLPVAERDFIARRMADLRTGQSPGQSRAVRTDRAGRADSADDVRIVVIGAGFAGLNALDELGKLARGRRGKPTAPRVQLTLVDRNSYSTFQPLLYQVATAGLTSADVAYPAPTAVRKAGSSFRPGEGN